MKKLITLAFCLVLSCFALPYFAGATQRGGEVLGFSRICYDPAAASMAGCGIAGTASTAFAAIGNIAMIPLTDAKFSASAAFQSWAPSSYKGRNFAAGVSGCIGRIGVAIATVSNNYPLIEGSDASETAKPRELLVGGGVSYRICDWLSAGVNLRYAEQHISDSFSQGSIMCDVYAGGKWKGLAVCGGICSLGTKVVANSGTSREASYSVPASARLGAEYSFSPAGNHSIRVLADADYYLSGAFSCCAGAEYGFRGLVFARAGYRYGGRSVVPSYASLGLGLHFKALRLDLAWLTGNPVIRNSLSAGLGISF